MASCKFCYQKTFCVLIYGKTVYIFSYTDVLHANIFSPFMIWTFYFVDSTRNLNDKGKYKSEKIQKVKIRLNLKAYDLSLTLSSNLLYFNFTKSR